jgi:hypothetical protein
MNTEDLNFAYKVRHALNENLDNLTPAAVARLSSARNIALSKKKADSPIRIWARQGVVAGAIGNLFKDPFTWMSRMGVALPLLVLVAGLVGIYEFEEQQHINETAEIDAAVLSDELPLTAYLDRGFNAYLAKRGEVN